MRRFRRSRSRYTSDYRRKRSTVVLRVVLAVLACAALFAVGFFVLEPWLDRVLPNGETPSSTAAPEPTAAPTASPTVSPTPEPTPTPAPVSVSYRLTDEELTDPAKRTAALAAAKAGGADTILLPLKGEDGRLRYQSETAEAKRIGAVLETAVDLPAVLSEIKEAGFSAAASLTVFDEPYTAAKDRKTAIKHNHSASVRWYDRDGNYWQDPGLAAARDYELALIAELAACDFSYVELSGCHYPVWGSLTGCTPDETHTREENIISFLSEAQTILHEAGSRLTFTLPADAVAADRHERYAFYGFPDDLSKIPCDTLCVDLRLDRILTHSYPALTLNGTVYEDLSDEETFLPLLYHASAARAAGIGARVGSFDAANRLKEEGAKDLILTR